MSGKWNHNWWLWLLVAGLHEVLSGVFGVQYNSGVSFGINFRGMMVLVVIMLAVAIWGWIKSRSWGWQLLAAGGAVNLLDRVRFGGVRDYWRIPGSDIYNNINDMVVFAGVILLLWPYIWKKSK